MDAILSSYIRTLRGIVEASKANCTEDIGLESEIYTSQRLFLGVFATQQSDGQQAFCFRLVMNSEDRAKPDILTRSLFSFYRIK